MCPSSWQAKALRERGEDGVDGAVYFTIVEDAKHSCDRIEWGAETELGAEKLVGANAGKATDRAVTFLQIISAPDPTGGTRSLKPPSHARSVKEPLDGPKSGSI
jgi:hypothetical protein